MSGAGDLQPELAGRLLTIMRAIDDVLVADHALRDSLKAPPPFGHVEGHRYVRTPLAAAVARYGLIPGTDTPSPLIALWEQCATIEALRFAWTGKTGPEIEALPDEPDEAPGLALPEPEAGNYPQERLAATQQEPTGDT